MPILQLPLGTKQLVIRQRSNSQKLAFIDFADSPPETFGQATPEPVIVEEGLTVGQLLKAADMLRGEAEKRDLRQNKQRRQT